MGELKKIESEIATKPLYERLCCWMVESSWLY